MKTITELQKELAAKQKQLDRLVAKRGQLNAQLQQVEVQIAAVQGKPRRGGKVKRIAKKGVSKGRKRATGSLADVLAKVMKGKSSVKVAQAAKMARGAGYKTRAKQFGNVVSQTLASDARFRKVRRGFFKLK